MSRTLLSEAALQLQQAWCNDYFFVAPVIRLTVFPRVLHEKLSAENWNRAAYRRKRFKNQRTGKKWQSQLANVVK